MLQLCCIIEPVRMLKIHSFILSLDPLDEQMFKLLVLIMRATVGGSNQDLHRSD